MCCGGQDVAFGRTASHLGQEAELGDWGCGSGRFGEGGRCRGGSVVKEEALVLISTGGFSSVEGKSPFFRPAEAGQACGLEGLELEPEIGLGVVDAGRAEIFYNKEMARRRWERAGRNVWRRKGHAKSSAGVGPVMFGAFFVLMAWTTS
jgi:hypothetical protein